VPEPHRPARAAARPRRGPGRLAVALVVAVLVGFQAASFWADPVVVDLYVSNLLQFAAGLTAAVCCALRARTVAGRARRSWSFLSAGAVAWAAGQGWWCWVQIVQSGEAPFPSVADVGFVAFPLLAGTALLLTPTGDSSTARWRRALDAAMTSAAVGLVSWETTLGTVVAMNSGNDPLVAGLLVGYPVLDVMLIVLGTLTVARATVARPPHVLVTLGLVAFAVSDSAFAYVAAKGDYDGNLFDIGWIAGFLMIALAALCRPGAVAPSRSRQRPGREGAADLLLYIPVAVAFAVTTLLAFTGRRLDGWELLTAGVVVALLLARQWLALRDNGRLAAELAARESELRHQAFHDALTGLANRALFLDRLDHALHLHARDLRPVAVVFLDLDDFKVVNDTLGHAVGDELLVRVAERLRGAVRAGDTVARLGGDEFAVLLEDGGDPAQTAAKVAGALTAPFTLRGDVVDVRASVGLCELSAADAPLAADELLARSDTAMYAAKRSGKDTIVAYSAGMSLAELEDEELRTALRAAIAAQRVRLAYQPIVDLDTGRLAGLEALARWRHEDRDVPPDVFIPLAERSGLMGPLTADLLDTACAQLAAWSTDRADLVVVHVNVAPSQLVAPGFVGTVSALVDRHALRPGALVLEITESGIFADLDAARRTVVELRRLGVGVSLDDFGVGYSSLAQLNAMPLDSVKIDRSFLAGVDSDPRQARFLHAVLRLAEEIDLPVVAEGVERPAQLTLLRALGCKHAQGYLLGRPVEVDAVPALLDGVPVPA
jgi:diguanylate cyclase (GGDEF)-like protein